jgi:hypothetical protein
MDLSAFSLLLGCFLGFCFVLGKDSSGSFYLVKGLPLGGKVRKI